jgi:hypothetical protein
MTSRKVVALSARNQLTGIVEEVQIEGLLAEVRLRDVVGLRERPFRGDDSRVVRYLLALALVLHFSGAPAVWAAPCSMTAARGEHACCLAQQGAAVARVTGSCGCQMTPPPAGELPSAVSAAPERGFANGVPSPSGSAVLPLLSVDPHVAGQPPPGPVTDRPLACLAGSGFRC